MENLPMLTVNDVSLHFPKERGTVEVSFGKVDMSEEEQEEFIQWFGKCVDHTSVVYKANPNDIYLKLIALEILTEMGVIKNARH